MVWEQQQPVLNFENQHLGYQKLGVATLDGVLHYPDGSNAYIGGKDYFKAAVSGRSVMSDPMYEPTTGKLSCMALVPIKGNSTVLGVMVATMDDQTLSKIVKEIEYGKSGQPAKPFLKSAKSSSKTAAIEAMKMKLEEEVLKL
jgi:methyl-accepting chemotaxis protein